MIERAFTCQKYANDYTIHFIAAAQLKKQLDNQKIKQIEI